MTQEFATRLDSRELVDKYDELEGMELWQPPLQKELIEEFAELKKVLDELRENCEEEPENGITMVLEKDWVLYVEELIDECYSFPELKTSYGNEWPYRHIKFDYEAAADELKSDYAEVEYQGATYICR